MLVPMTKVRLLGAAARSSASSTSSTGSGLVEIADARASLAGEELGGDEERARRRERLRRLAAQTDGAARADRGRRPTTRCCAGPARPAAGPRGARGRAGTDPERGRGLGEPARRRSGTSSCVLPGFLEPLRRLLPLVPELADLDDEELRRAPARHRRARAQHRRRAARRGAPRAARRGARSPLRAGLDPRAERAAWAASSCFRSTSAAPSTRCSGTCRCVRLELPEAFQRLSLRAAVEAMQRRLGELPEAIAGVETRARGATAPACRAARRPARGDRRRARTARRGRPIRRDAARVRRRVLGAAARAGAPATRGRSAARRRRSRRGSRRRPRATRRRRC